MSLIMKTKTIPPQPSREVTEVDGVKCELCGAVGRDQKFNEAGDYGKGNYDVSSTQVTMDEGYHYPEGGVVTTTAIDICPTCFRDKLIPWVRAQGGTERTKERDT